MRGFYRFAWTLTRILMAPFIWVRYTGRENIPVKGGYVVAANHRSYIDPIMVAHGITRRQVYYMAKAELLRVPVLGKAVSGLGVFPVERGTGDMGAVEHAIQKLRDGGLLGIFPEGTRSLSPQPGRFKSGMAHIAKSAGVGVLPCAVRFTGKMGLFKRVEVRYGQPFSYDELFGEEQSAAALKRATKLVQARITEMLELGEAAQ